MRHPVPGRNAADSMEAGAEVMVREDTPVSHPDRGRGPALLQDIAVGGDGDRLRDPGGNRTHDHRHRRQQDLLSVARIWASTSRCRPASAPVRFTRTSRPMWITSPRAATWTPGWSFMRPIPSRRSWAGCATIPARPIANGAGCRAGKRRLHQVAEAVRDRLRLGPQGQDRIPAAPENGKRVAIVGSGTRRLTAARTCA